MNIYDLSCTDSTGSLGDKSVFNTTENNLEREREREMPAA